VIAFFTELCLTDMHKHARHHQPKNLSTPLVPSTSSTGAASLMLGVCGCESVSISSNTVTDTVTLLLVSSTNLIVFELQVLVTLRLSSIGYELNMYFSLFCILDTPVLLRLIVLYLTIILFLFLSFHLECNHVDLLDSIMPVTTRSQTKCLSSANHSILEVSSNQTGLKLSETLPVTSCISPNSPSHCMMVTASGASRFNNLAMAVSSIQRIPDQVALADRGSTCESISKFRIFKRRLVI
jgi:hypothetical protein